MIVPRALLFDMDGTLTEPLLDFAEIRREIGLTDDSILEQMERMTKPERQRAEEILHRHEREAAAASTLNPGCREVLDLARRWDLPVSVITRNSLECAEIVMRKHNLIVDALLTRDDGMFKPSPEPLLHACAKLGVPPGQTWMTGDGEFDVIAGRAAGAWTVWLNHGRARRFATPAHHEVHDMLEFLDLLRSVRADETG